MAAAGGGGCRGVGAGPQRAAGHGAGGARHGAAAGGSGAGAAGGAARRGGRAAGRPVTPLFSPQILEEVCRKQGGSPGEYGLK